jgi:hypothetical protein
MARNTPLAICIAALQARALISSDHDVDGTG